MRDTYIIPLAFFARCEEEKQVFVLSFVVVLFILLALFFVVLTL